MDQSPAPQPETLEPPYEAWRRFTLLDLMILFTGHGAAMGLLKWHGLMSENNNLNYPVPLPVTIYLIFILGGILSIPVVLLVQFSFRHRKEKIKGGEYLAIGYCILWAIVFFGIQSYPVASLIIPIYFITLIGLPIFLLGGYLFVKSVFTSDLKAECKWLGLYGYFLCFVSVVFSLMGWILAALY